MVEDSWVPGPDDTQSFSISEAVRAPIGTTIDDDGTRHMRGAAAAFLVGTGLLVAPWLLSDWLAVQVLGALIVGLGCLRVAAVARLVGPARAGSRVLLLAVMHLGFVVARALPDSVLVLDMRGDLALASLQATTALLGTALSATVLARAHDGLDQLGRRDRWARVRRVALLGTVLWPLLGLVPLAFLDAGPAGVPVAVSGLSGALLRVGGVLLGALGLGLVVLLGLALTGSANVRLAVGHGES